MNSCVIEIDAVQFDGDRHLVNALARQPGLMEAARQAARSKRGLYVQFRIESTPLDQLTLTLRDKGLGFAISHACKHLTSSDLCPSSDGDKAILMQY